MEEKLIELIKNLHLINTNQNLKVRYDGHYQIDQPIISKTISLANECLINSQRQAIVSNISLISRYGFPTYAGDIDNCGVQTGIIELNDGVIMFG